jgi:phage replication O-like protein O
MGFSPPNYTQTPNELFDYWLPKLKLVELRVLMVIFRKTFGWHKTRDRISLSQLQNLTGSHHQDIAKATFKLEQLGLITKEVLGEKGNQQTFYELVIKEDKIKEKITYEEIPPRKYLRGNTSSQKKDSLKEKKTPISPKRGLRSILYEKRKKWAYANQNNSPGGSSVALEDRYVIHSGSAPPQVHWYAKRDPFWENIDNDINKSTNYEEKKWVQEIGIKKTMAL